MVAAATTMTPHQQPDIVPTWDDEIQAAREAERHIVRRAIQRDPAAFSELYSRHATRVQRHVYYLVRDLQVAEDLTAQTFLKAWQAIERYNERGTPVVAWLMRIAHNLAVSHLRARREHGALDEAIVDHKRHGDPEAILEQSSDELSVREAVRHLHGEQRRVILLRFVEEKDYREVAQIIGKSVPAVRVIQHRAIGNLRRIMQEQSASAA